MSNLALASHVALLNTKRRIRRRRRRKTRHVFWFLLLTLIMAWKKKYETLWLVERDGGVKAFGFGYEIKKREETF